MKESVTVTEGLDVTQTPAAEVATEIRVPVPLGVPTELPVRPEPVAPVVPAREPQPTAGSGN